MNHHKKVEDLDPPFKKESFGERVACVGIKSSILTHWREKPNVIVFIRILIWRR